jgi:hypothetical protein
MQVFEKYSLSGEVGAAVSLGSNAVAYLQSLGFDIDRAKICRGEWHQPIPVDAYLHIYLINIVYQ